MKHDNAIDRLLATGYGRVFLVANFAVGLFLGMLIILITGCGS